MSRIVALDYRKVPSFKPIFLDYLHRFTKLSPFFEGDPFDPESWRAQSRRLEAREYPRTAVSGALRELNRSLGADEKALAAVGALEEGALAVVTGQQVGLFGGPLYTLYKALSAVRLARWAESLLGRKVVPLFWMDADDHDFDEVRSTYLLDPPHELFELRYGEPGGDERPSVGSLPLSPAIEEALKEASEVLPDSEFKPDLFEILRQCYAPGHTLAQAFGRWLLHITRGSGLAVVDPTMSALKSLAADLFEREVVEESESSRLVRRTTEDLLGRGYHAQANPTDSQLNLFYAKPSRHPVAMEPSGLRLSLNGEVLPKDDVRRLIRDEPECFSPNVLLRPIYQDSLLPTLAYVAGPNELAYFAQLRQVYRHFGVTMPLVASRTSLTVIERPQARFLDRYQVELVRLQSADESLLNEILRQHTPPQLDDDLTRARSCIQEITKALENDLAKVDRTLVPTVESTRGKLLHQLKDLESKAFRAVKRKNDTVRQQFLATRSALFPGFDLQERKLSSVGFFNKYGWHFSRMIEEAIEPETRAHLLVYI